MGNQDHKKASFFGLPIEIGNTCKKQETSFHDMSIKNRYAYLMQTKYSIYFQYIYPFTVFRTRSFSERFPLLADHGTSALTKAGVGPP